jgi:hypothetical protein
MIATTSNWQAVNAQMAKMPIYVFALSGQATATYTTHDLARFGVIGYPAYAPWLKTPAGSSQTIDVINGASSIGDLTCEVLDHGGAVRQLVGQNTLEGSTVTLLAGYPGLAWTDFATLGTYVLYKINPSSGYTSFNFICRDAQLLEKTTVYTHPENGYVLSDDNPWYLSGTPAEIFQAITLAALGLSASQIDLATMTALDCPQENIFGPWRPFQFALVKSFEGKQFLETEIFKPSGLYQVVLPNGQLSLRSMRPPAAGPSPVFTFTEANLVEFPRWDRQAIVNQAIWQFDAGQSGYANYETFLQATSISLYGRGNQFSVQSQGLRTELGAFGFSEWMTGRLFRRFSGADGAIKGGAPLLTVRAMLLTLPVWVGDYVALTHTKMPDITTGNLGVTNRIFEVIERQPNYASGTMQYKLLDTGLTGAPAAYQFGAGSARPFIIGASPVY